MKSVPFNASLLAAAVALALSPVAHSAQPQNRLHFGKNAPFLLEDLPDGKLKDKLKGLPADKRDKAMQWLHSFAFTRHDLMHLRIDDDGGVLYSDTFDMTDPADTAINTAETPQAIGPADTFSLHSKPGASNVIFIDVDGHTLSGTAWNTSYATLYALPFDTDGDTATFGAIEHAQIAEIWHRVAEDYAPFDVDVTTEEPSSFGPTTGRILITHNTDAAGNSMPYPSAGGVAYVNVWNNPYYASYYSPALVYYNNLASYPAYIAEASSHEMGHNLSLSHDGTSTQGYYGGHGSGFVSWGPIMGVGYYSHVTQWSKGEYTDASQAEDDINLITNRLNLRPDDHGDDMTQPTPLLVDTLDNIASTSPESDPYNLAPENKGIIETRNDVDFFAFDAGSGDLTLTVTPAWEAFYNNYRRGANLDIKATLYNWNGQQLATSDPEDDTDAVIATTVPAGQYLLAVTGVGNAVTPYSDYGSLGQYYISGHVVPFSSTTDTSAPEPNPLGWMVAPYAQSRTEIGMQATIATDDSGGVAYNFSCVGLSSCVASGWQASNQYTATNLQPDTVYTFQAVARDAFGNETSPAQASATTTANAIPQSGNGTVSTAEDSAVLIDLNTLVSDADGDPLSYSIQTQPAHGTAILANGLVNYTPDANYNGGDGFVYSVNDGFGDSSNATVSITVVPVNDAPIAVASAPSSNTTLTVNFSGGDSYDPDSADTLSYVWDFGDGNGSTAANPSHTYTSAGSYAVTLTVFDTGGLSDSVTLSTSVVDPNNALPGTPGSLSYSIDSVVTGKGKDRTVTGTVRLEWLGAEFATEYRIWSCQEVAAGKGRDKTTSCSYPDTPLAAITSTGSNTASYTTELVNGTVHYKVSAHNANGSSDFSNEVFVSP